MTRNLSAPWPFPVSVLPASGLVRNVSPSTESGAGADSTTGPSLRDELSKKGIKPSVPTPRKKRQAMNSALLVLMEAATNDVRGSGLGVRSTSDEWRAKVAEAWAVAWLHVYGWEPTESDYFNAGMKPPHQQRETP